MCLGWLLIENGISPREPGLALRVDAVTGSFIDPGPLAWRSPLTFGSGRWVPGLPHADLRASVCPDQGLPTPYPASLGWINGPQPWLGCLALVPCGLWPQAPRASCWAGDSTVTEHVNRPEAGGRQCPAPPRPAPWAPWRLAGRCRRSELSPEACCLVTFLPGYSSWSPRA